MFIIFNRLINNQFKYSHFSFLNSYHTFDTLTYEFLYDILATSDGISDTDNRMTKFNTVCVIMGMVKHKSKR